MAKLDDQIKTHIVQALACYDTPAQIVAAVKDEFGAVVTRQQVQCYDPEKVAGRALAKRWRDVFFATRDAFVRDAAAIPIAHQTFRLRSLQRMFEVAEARGNMPLAASLLEQAAKEVGGAFTNRREHSGPAGGPLPLAGEHIHRLSDARLERIAKQGEACGPRQSLSTRVSGSLQGLIRSQHGGAGERWPSHG